MGSLDVTPTTLRRLIGELTGWSQGKVKKMMEK
jgi:hypothetical protein